jgi:KaiC/GvpD/RAD55 family RecA-like ATPase
MSVAEKIDSAIARRGGAAAVVAAAAAVGVGKLDIVMADALDVDDIDFDDELIEGFLGSGSLAVFYGDSNCGKTFVVIDLGASVAQGVPWMGRETVGGLVVYLAAEAPASVQTRLRAYRRHHGVPLRLFAVVRSPVNLFDGDFDTRAVVEAIHALESEHGEKVALVVGDTLARLAEGANENAGDDMGIVLRNVDAIRRETGAAFLLVHHTGKDAAKGMRGWSGLRAAIDTEVEVTSNEATGDRVAEVTKQRDIPGKGERIGFRLEPLTVGRNRWGKARTSCVVVPVDAPPRAAKQRRGAVAGAVVEYLTAKGSGCLRGALAKHFEGRYVRASIYREVDKLIEAGELMMTGGVVALPGMPA